MLQKTIQAQMNIDFLSLTQRVVKASDRPFLQDLYCASRDHEVLQADMSNVIIRPLLLQPFLLQQKHYYQSYKISVFKLNSRRVRQYVVCKLKIAMMIFT